ncbi:MAG: Trk system potassium transporter TrkA [Planctomycetota bacterium]
MNVVICGAGEVGRALAEALSLRGEGVTVIDRDPAKLTPVEESLDVRLLAGNAAQAEVLIQAGVPDADLYVAATQSDEINMLACSTAKGLGCSQVIARVHHRDYYERRGFDYADHLGIDQLVCPEAVTARAIAATLRRPGASAVESFARGAVEMSTMPVDEGADASGQALRDLDLTGSRLVVLEREGQAVLPNADTQLRAGDLVTLIGDRKGFDKARRVFTKESSRRRKVMVMGGSPQSVWLCRELRWSGASVRLFVSREWRASDLAEKLDWVTVINADVINTDVLKEERVDQSDAFVAATDDEETNILAAARAKAMGARMAVSVLQRPTYRHLLGDIGIDYAFSPREAAVSEILRLLDTGPVKRVAALAEDIAEVFEVRVTKQAKSVVGRRLADVPLPEHCIVAVIQREGEAFVPGADSQFKYGDMAVVIGPADRAKGLRKLFA